MAISSQDYFLRLKDWLNKDHYISFGHPATPSPGNNSNVQCQLELIETLPNATGRKPKIGNTATLHYRGDAFAVNLDLDEPGRQRQNLFHFFNNSGAWTKRCDFVVFHFFRKINVYCIEFKSDKIDQKHISDQLNRGRDWVASMQAALYFYEKEKRPFYLSRYIFTTNVNPSGFVNSSGFLTVDSKVKLWRYEEVKNLDLQSLGGCQEVLR